MPEPALLTAADLAAIEARVKAATPGPWKMSSTYPTYRVKAEQYLVCAKKAESDRLGAKARADLAFTAHARTDLPSAVATIRALAEAILEAGDKARLQLERHDHHDQPDPCCILRSQCETCIEQRIVAKELASIVALARRVSDG